MEHLIEKYIESIIKDSYVAMVFFASMTRVLLIKNIKELYVEDIEPDSNHSWYTSEVISLTEVNLNSDDINPSIQVDETLYNTIVDLFSIPIDSQHNKEVLDDLLRQKFYSIFVSTINSNPIFSEKRAEMSNQNFTYFSRPYLPRETNKLKFDFKKGNTVLVKIP